MSDLELYLSLPWTIRRSVRNDDGRYFVLTVDELEGFVVTGRTYDELNENFWPALSAFIQSYLEDGEEPPMPEKARDLLERARAAITEFSAQRVSTSRRKTTVQDANSRGPIGAESQREITAADFLKQRAIANR